MENRRGACRVKRRNLRERDHLEDPGVGGKMFLNGSSRSRMGRLD
jgi:hypothetical protein